MRVPAMILIAASAATSLLAATAALAQVDPHRMVRASELKWQPVPSLPKGALLAVIEGPMNEAVPFTVRLKFPANYRVAAHWHPAWSA
jgi:hypothetical protein